MYACMRYCTAKLESQRTAGSKTPGEGAQRPRAALNYALQYYTIDTRGTGGHAGAGGSGGTPKGLESTRGIQEIPRGPEGTAGGSRETPRGPGGTTGGSEQATRTQQPCYSAVQQYL
jgi:hypothetical protein